MVLPVTVAVTAAITSCNKSTTATAVAGSNNSRKSDSYNRNHYQSLVKRVNAELKSVQYPSSSSSNNNNGGSNATTNNTSNTSNHNNNTGILQEARDIASKAGLSIESDLRNIHMVVTTSSTSTTTTIPHKEQPTARSKSSSSIPSIPSGNTNTSVVPIVSTTTGGYSNTDHIITSTGGYDDRTDRINEYKRQYMIRQRTVTNSETKLVTQKWDKHRIMGERRRRIVRDIDLPNAPMEPPPSGYILFLGQMTTKMRYDNYKRNMTATHDQTKIVQEISNMWKSTLNDNDREYYQNFYLNLKREYRQQIMEYRATGYYTPSTLYRRNHSNVGLWTHIRPDEANALEMEIRTYETIQFPSTQMDVLEQQRRMVQSKEKRKRKLQQQRDEALLKQQQQHEEKEGNGPVVGGSTTAIIKRRRRRQQSTTTTTESTITAVTPSTTAVQQHPVTTTISVAAMTTDEYQPAAEI